MKVDISNLKALVTDANGIQKVMTLQDLAQLKLMPDMRVIIIDAETGKPVEHVSVRKDGDDLVFEVKGEGEIARLEDYYIDSGFSTVDAVPEGAAGPEAGAAAAAGGGLFGGAELGTIGLLALGGVGAGALLASGGSGGGGGGSSSTPPSFTLVEGVGGDAVDQLAMEVGDELVAERDSSGEITGFLLNGEPIGAETLAAIDRLGNGSGQSFYDPVSQTNYEKYDGFYFDSLGVSSDGVFITRQAGEGTLNFNVDNKSDLSTLIKGDLFVEADSAYVKFGAEEDAASVYSELAAISVIADENAELELSNQGVENFMSSLRTIHIESNGDSDGTAQLHISASTNYDFNSETGEPVGNGFLDALQTITVLGSVHANASVSISHSGSENFMASLKSIHVEATGENASADVSISASANQIEVDGEIAYLSGADFMPSLQSITVISEQYTASLSLSHSGGSNFMQSLKTIEVQGAEATQISISASANNKTDGDIEVLQLTGDNFMQSLETITLDSNAYFASISISHSGSAFFMKSLLSMEVTAAHYAQISLSNSANYEGATGDNFMQSLDSILIASDGEGKASLSISNDGGDFFANALTEITVSSGALGTFKAVVDISNSTSDFATTGIDRDSDNFMTMLDTINVVSVGGAADVRLLNKEGENFLSALETVNVDGLYGNIDLAGPMGKTSGNLIFDVTDVDDLAFIQTHRADFDNAATTTLITEIGSSNLQYNAIFESGIDTLGNGFMATADAEVYVYIDLPPVQGQSASTNVADITDGDYEGFGGIGIDTPSGWVSLGSNDVKDVFAYNDSDMGDAVIGGFDDGLDQFDFSALGALFSGTINDQSTATAHVGTDQGDILVTQSDDAAADAIIWLNTEGGTTTDFADFEASIYIVDGSAMTWDSNDMMFGA